MKTSIIFSLYLVVFCFFIKLLRAESSLPTAPAQSSILSPIKQLEDNKVTFPIKDASTIDSAKADNKRKNFCAKFDYQCQACVNQPFCYFCVNDQRCLPGSIVIKQFVNNMNISLELDGPYCRASAFCNLKDDQVFVFSMVGAWISFFTFCYVACCGRKKMSNVFINNL